MLGLDKTHADFVPINGVPPIVGRESPNRSTPTGIFQTTVLRLEVAVIKEIQRGLGRRMPRRESE